MIIDIICFTKFSFSSLVLQNLSDNFNIYPITDIIESIGSCPSEYLPFINDKWPGFVEGCDCSDSWGYDVLRDIHRGSCTMNETLAYCKDLPYQDPIPFARFRNKILCVKRGRENYLDYSKNKKISKDSYCGYGKKFCGKLDTIDNYLCLNENENCPITQMIIQDYTLNPPKNKNFTSINLANGKILYFTNKNATKDDSILINVKISEGLPCLNTYQENTKNKFTKYILDANYDYYTCSEYLNMHIFDDRYRVLDSLNYRDLLNDNGINYIINRYPRVPTQAVDFNVELYQRPYLGWKLSCLNDRSVGIEFIKDYSNNLKAVSSKLLTLMILAIISFVLYMLSFCFIASKENKIGLIFILIISIINLVMVILVFLTYGELKGISIDDLQINDLNCGDDYTNLFFKYMIEIINNLPTNLFWNGLLLISNLLLKICPIFLGYRRNTDSDLNTFIYIT